MTKRKQSTYGVLTVSNPDRPDERPLKLTLADGAFDSTFWMLRHRGYSVERSAVNRLFRRGDDVLSAVEAFLGKREDAS
jgi:hypothetical protein